MVLYLVSNSITPYYKSRMKQIIIYLLLLICTTSYSQKQLSPQAINEMVNKASSFLGVGNNEKVRSAFNRYIATYNRAGASSAMANLRKELKGRDDLLAIMNRATSSRGSMLATLAAMDLNPKNVEEIADYFFPQQATQKTIVKDTVAFPEEPQQPVKEVTEPVVWVEPSKKFFDGRKTFCDSTGKFYYTAIIIRSNILIMKYEGNPLVRDPQRTPVLKVQAALNGESIVSSGGQPSNYKYENNIFYERAEGSDQWNKYVECKE